MLHLIMACSIVIAVFAQEAPELEEASMVDPFGDEIDIPLVESKISLRWNLHMDPSNCGSEKAYLIDPDGNEINSAECSDRVMFEMEVREYTKFGDYHCKFKGQMSKQGYGSYFRLCDESEKACRDKVTRTECPFYSAYYCVVSQNGVEPCKRADEAFNKTWCTVNTTSDLYCPREWRSLCMAKATRSRGRVDYKSHTNHCLADSSQSRKPEIKTTPGRMYNEPIIFSSSSTHESVDVVCPEGSNDEFSNLIVECYVKDKNSAVVESKTFDQCLFFEYHEYTFNKSGNLTSGFDIYKFTCLFRKGQTVLFRTDNYLHTFAPIVTVRSRNTSDGTLVECHFDPSIPVHLDFNFIWFRRGNDKFEFVQRGPEFVANKSGTYYCEYNSYVSTCTPHQPHLFWGFSNEVHVGVLDPLSKQFCVAMADSSSDICTYSSYAYLESTAGLTTEISSKTVHGMSSKPIEETSTSRKQTSTSSITSSQGRNGGNEGPSELQEFRSNSML